MVRWERGPAKDPLPSSLSSSLSPNHCGLRGIFLRSVGRTTTLAYFPRTLSAAQLHSTPRPGVLETRLGNSKLVLFQQPLTLSWSWSAGWENISVTTLRIESLLPASNFFREFNTARFDIREMVCYLLAPLKGVERLLARANERSFFLLWSFAPHYMGIWSNLSTRSHKHRQNRGLFVT